MLTEPEPGPDHEGESTPNPPAMRWVAVDERRQATRFPREAGTDFAVIWRDQGEGLLVEVHDESLTGLGILVDAEAELQLGNHIHIVYVNEYMVGEVRHIERQPDGKYLVGLRCEKAIP